MSVPTPSSQTAEIPRPVDTIGSSGEAHRTGHVPELHIEVPDARSDSESSDEDDTDSEYATASESESEGSDNEEELSEEARWQEREARAAERQRVLEAAGLIIKQESQPPPRPVRRASRRRRPAPAVPERPSQLSPSPSPHKGLPALPDAGAEGEEEGETEENGQSFRLDDAYERYEAFRQSHLSASASNRLSMASVESGTSAASPTAPSFASAAQTPTVEERHGGSGFLHFFGRSRTPANEGDATSTRPIISAPILQREPSPGLEAEFGSVSAPSWVELVEDAHI